ncbi:hypothetical protein BU23DRAFT_531901 [Bimuria novae-zelandiae CBS 107.79]|uniref:Uncharacterized protein n=1 Tax=Bimuria novae-zelandiae CBS 107.79 TaxID=1447943 RepID=A0A6A5VB46_9PLEO|nr:hypothetical protein BU23DRAFT_531901 [Bimuria novae-zelandiae CBS 107.79]
MDQSRRLSMSSSHSHTRLIVAPELPPRSTSDLPKLSLPGYKAYRPMDRSRRSSISSTYSHTRLTVAPILPRRSISEPPESSLPPLVATQHGNSGKSDETRLHVETKTFKPTTWLPLTLRKPFLLLLAATSFIIVMVITVLCWYSAQHRGIANDDGSPALFFAWRYVPTIIAVLYAQCCIMVAADVKRTEPFARMAHPDRIECQHTLLYVPKPWWKSVYIWMFKKRRGGPTARVLTLSSVAAAVASLVISTLSSSFFTTSEFIIRQSVPLQRQVLGSNGTISLAPRRDTYLHTISGFLRNTSTSMWVSDSYMVVPFVPGVDNDTKSGSLPDGVWEAETKVLQMTYDCASMTMTDKDPVNITLSSDEQGSVGMSGSWVVPAAPKGFKLVSEDGCALRVQSPIYYEGNSSIRAETGDLMDDFTEYGGALWTNMSDSYASWTDLIEDEGRQPNNVAGQDPLLNQWTRTFIYDLTNECRGRDLLLATPPWYTNNIPDEMTNNERRQWQDQYWANFSARALVCSPAYHEANMLVTASVGGSHSHITFNTSDHERLRKPIANTSLDLHHLNDLAFTKDWPKYLVDTSGGSLDQDDATHSQDAALLLAKSFSYNTTAMMQNITLGTKAGRFRARFFHELLLSSLNTADMPAMEPVTGNVPQVQKRILVAQDVAITLAVFMGLGLCYFAFMAWSVAAHRRPLGIRNDPATLAGMMSLITTETKIATDLRNVKSSGRPEMKRLIGSCVFGLRGGMIVEQQNPGAKSKAESVIEKSINPANKSEKQAESSVNLIMKPGKRRGKPSQGNWRPPMLRLTCLAIFFVGLSAITVTLLVLRSYARRNRLIQKAFVYQADLGVFNITFSPHSMIATLIAVLVGQCWEEIDNPMRTLQPYLSLSRGPQRGVFLSYRSSYWAWAAIKAVQSRHGLLCLVTAGTTLSQILIISMAATFGQDTVTREVGTQIHQPVIARQLPIEFGIDMSKPWADISERQPFYLSEMLLKTDDTEWLRTAMDEITSNTPTLAWTKDEWVFMPMNTTTISGDATSTEVSSVSGSQDAFEYAVSSANVTYTTSALRGRLECNALSVPMDWLDQVQDLFRNDPIFQNRNYENITGYVLPNTLFSNTSKAPIFTVPRRMACCANGTDPEKQSTIAYWSNNSTLNEEETEVPVGAEGPEVLRVPGNYPRHFLIKWIVGQAATTPVSGAEALLSLAVGNGNETLLYFLHRPQISIMECTPIIEQANASITFAKTSSQIFDFHLLHEPHPAPGAWDHAYDIEYSAPRSSTCRGNVSYGFLFLSQMLTAPHIVRPEKYTSWLSFNGILEDLNSEHFNIRDSNNGYNMDFMSYATLHLAGMNNTALLAPETLLRHSQKTFQTFFKHFAATGRWTYGATPERTVFENLYERSVPRAGRGSRSVNATLTERIVVLKTNEVALWLSLGIIFALLGILLVLIVSLRVVYPASSLQFPLECVADFLCLVAGSDELMRLVHSRGREELERSGVETRLGWFRDRRGAVRWGVERVGGGVEWVDGRGRGGGV